MSKIEVDWQAYLSETLDALVNGGLLLTSMSTSGKPNPMTIGWAAFGVLWGYPVATVMVRPSRYTFGCIEQTGDFTISVPYRSLSENVIFCGTTSGREVDKFAECGFTAVPHEAVSSPGIGQCGLIYFCRVVHANDVLPAALEEDIERACYPSGDYHRFYHGIIEAVVADPDFSERYAAEKGG